MAIIIIRYQDKLQFSGFTPDSTAMPRQTAFSGTDAFFSSFAILDVTLEGRENEQFFFNPNLIYPTASGSPDASNVSFQSSVEDEALILIKPPVSVFAGYGRPMLIVRRVNLPGDPRLFSGVPTLLSYFESGVRVLFELADRVSSVPRKSVAEPSDFPNPQP